jgi:hypothetical protein
MLATFHLMLHGVAVLDWKAKMEVRGGGEELFRLGDYAITVRSLMKNMIARPFRASPKRGEAEASLTNRAGLRPRDHC